MPGEGCVCKHPARIDELPHARVFIGEQFEKRLGLGHARPLEQVVFRTVEFREELRIGRGVVDRREPEPLGGEALVEPLPLRIGEHAFGLLAEHHGIAELPLPGHFEQLLVGRRVPEQIREPRGEREIGERARLLDDAEEVGIHEQVAKLIDDDVGRVAAGVDIGPDRGHHGGDLVVGQIAAEEPRRHPADRLLHDGDELVGLHRLEIGDRPAILPQFLVEFRRKIGRHEPLGDRRRVRGRKLDPLHGQTGLAQLRGVAGLRVLRHRHAEAERHEPDTVAAAVLPLLVHVAAAEIDLGLEHGRPAGRGVEDGEQFDDLWVGAGVPGVDAEGQRLVGLVAVDGEADLVEPGRNAPTVFQLSGVGVGVERDDRLGIEHEQVAA